MAYPRDGAGRRPQGLRPDPWLLGAEVRMRVGSEAKRCPQHLGVICTGCPPPPHQLWLTGIGVGNEVGGEGSALGRARGLGARQSQSLPVPRFSLGTHEGPLRPSPLDAGLTQGQEASREEKALQAWVADGRACHSRASPECQSQQSGLCRRPSGTMKDSARGGGHRRPLGGARLEAPEARERAAAWTAAGRGEEAGGVGGGLW